MSRISKVKIKTYDTAAFRERYVSPEEKLNPLLKSDFGKFFIVKVEDMIRFMKLPVPPTKATAHTIIYLTHGTAEMSVGGVFFKIRQRELLIVQAGQIFSIGNVDVNSGQGFLINFHQNVMVGKLAGHDFFSDLEFLMVWSNPHVKPDKKSSPAIEQLLKRMHEVYATEGLSNLKLFQSYLIACMCEIEIAYAPPHPQRQSKSNSLVNTFRSLLFSSVRTMQRVSDYADAMKITPNHLNKIVKSTTGKSPTKWIDEALLLEAKALLHQTDLSVNEIAEEIGIFDPSYFSRLFKKYEGVTPLEFRKKIGH